MFVSEFGFHWWRFASIRTQGRLALRESDIGYPRVRNLLQKHGSAKTGVRVGFVEWRFVLTGATALFFAVLRVLLVPSVSLRRLRTQAPPNRSSER